jgi:hypothetical protein
MMLAWTINHTLVASGAPLSKRSQRKLATCTARCLQQSLTAGSSIEACSEICSYLSVRLTQLLLLLLLLALAAAAVGGADRPKLLASFWLGCQQQLGAVDVASSRQACRKREADTRPGPHTATHVYKETRMDCSYSWLLTKSEDTSSAAAILVAVFKTGL